jgi:energy-coupling factor transport system permease protein
VTAALETAQRGPLAALHPLAKLLTSLVIALGLILSIDVVSAGVAALFALILLPLSGLPARELWLRTAPVWIGAPLTGMTILLYGETSGTVYWQFLLARVSDGSLELALATALRVIAIGLPAVVLFARVDPTELADGLAQLARLPSRFVLGALAGLRLVALMREDWQALQLARRARGVGDTGRVRRFAGSAFALLVLAVRRGGRLATAMEGRGFGTSRDRTWARESRFQRADLVLIACGVLVVAAAVSASASSGSWNFIAG